MLKPALPEALSHQGEGFFRLLTNPIQFQVVGSERISRHARPPTAD